MGYPQKDLFAVVVAQMPPSRLADFMIGSLLAVANIDKIKGCFTLREAQHKVSEVGFTIHGAVTLHCFVEACEVGHNFGDNLRLVRAVTALCYGFTKSVSRLLSSL